MGLTDEISDIINNLARMYRREYPDDNYEYSQLFKDMLFQMLKALYVFQLPEYKMITLIQLPNDEWIRNHIETLIMLKHDRKK